MLEPMLLLTYRDKTCRSAVTGHVVLFMDSFSAVQWLLEMLRLAMHGVARRQSNCDLLACRPYVG